MKLSALSVALLLIAGPTLAIADDLDDSLAALKAAESSKDAAKIKDLAAKAHATAVKWQAPPPADVTDKEAYQARADYAKDVDEYSEYALYALAIQSAPATGLDLINTLEKQNPKSKYLEQPRVLMILADNAYSHKQVDRAMNLSSKLIAVNSRKAPEGVSEADWEKTKSAAVGLGYWLSGVIHGEKNQYRDADKDLRAALPLIKGNNAMMAPALFYLGVANYNLGRLLLNKAKMLEGAKFSQECAAIASPYQTQAYNNAAQIQREASQMR